MQLKKIKLFNLSFEDAKKVVLNRFLVTNPILDAPTGPIWGFFIRFVGFILYSLVYMTILIIVKAPVDLPPSEHVKYISPTTSAAIYKIGMAVHKPLSVMIIILCGLAFILEVYWIFAPRKNFIVYRIRSSRWPLLLVISIEVGMLPIIIGSTYANANGLALFLEILFVFLLNLYLIVRKGENQRLKYIFSRLFSIAGIASYLITLTVIIFVSYLIMGMEINKYRLLLAYSFILMYLIFTFVNYLMFLGGLTYHYIKKYPNEFRVYYKITDEQWYFTKKNAAKHEPVYPIPNKKKGVVNEEK